MTFSRDGRAARQGWRSIGCFSYTIRTGINGAGTAFLLFTNALCVFRNNTLFLLRSLLCYLLGCLLFRIFRISAASYGRDNYNRHVLQHSLTTSTPPSSVVGAIKQREFLSMCIVKFAL